MRLAETKNLTTTYPYSVHAHNESRATATDYYYSEVKLVDWKDFFVRIIDHCKVHYKVN